jgi:hypothetical protein
MCPAELAVKATHQLQMHRRMKGDAEWKSVTQKVEGECFNQTWTFA